MTERPVVAVIGAGVAGLSAAHRLLHPTDRSAPQVEPDVRILEESDRVGGKVLSERFDGFVVEAGADSFLRTKPWALDLIRELGLEDDVQTTEPAPQRAFLRRGSRLHPLPAGLTGTVPGRLGPILRSPLLSRRARLRVALEPLVPARTDASDESAESLIRRRFGDEAFERLVEPLLSGIHGAPADQLSAEATVPALVEAERSAGSVLRGMRRMRGSASASGDAPFVSLRGGMDRLPAALLESVGAGRVTLNTKVVATHPRDEGWSIIEEGGREWRADAVVLTTPANVSADITEAIARLSARLAELRFGSTAIISAAFGEGSLPRLPSGHGYLNPPTEMRAVSACTWSSMKLSGRAPKGFVLVRGFVRGSSLPAPGPDGDARLETLFLEELSALLGPTEAPAWCRVRRWDEAMPIYEVGHLGRVRALRTEAAALPGLFLAGASYDGVGLPDTIRSAQDAAIAATQFLAEARRP